MNEPARHLPDKECLSSRWSLSHRHSWVGCMTDVCLSPPMLFPPPSHKNIQKKPFPPNLKHRRFKSSPQPGGFRSAVTVAIPGLSCSALQWGSTKHTTTPSNLLLPTLGFQSFYFIFMEECNARPTLILRYWPTAVKHLIS